MNSVNWDPSHDWDRYHDAMQERAEAEMWSEAIEETSFGQEAAGICRHLKEYDQMFRSYSPGAETEALCILREELASFRRLLDLITGDHREPEPEEPIHFNPAE